MKSVVLCSVLVGAIASSALAILPAHAQRYSIPVSNGSFTLTNSGGGNQYSTPITLLSPAGTINVTRAPYNTYVQPGITVTTNTPVRFLLENFDGNVALNDGRSGTFLNAIAGLETEATLAAGAIVWNTTEQTVPIGATVNVAVRNGYLTFNEAVLSPYPTPQFSIPITGGSFAMNSPAGAAPDTITLNSVLTPLGTTNLAIANPILVGLNDAYPAFVGAAGENLKLGGAISGTVTLNNGKVATLNGLPFSMNVAVGVADGSGTTLFDTYPVAKTFNGTIQGGFISVPQSAMTDPVTLPTETQPSGQPSLNTPPVLPDKVEPLPANSVLSQTPSQPLLVTRPQPISTPLARPSSLNVGFTANPTLNDLAGSGIRRNQDLEEESPLTYSRIHGAVNARNR